MDWDRRQCDVLVAGSGGGGVTGAYTAAREGLEVILVEATDKFGGTTAYSGGGGMWFPCNPVLQRAGTDDTIDDALEYYHAVVGDRTPRASAGHLRPRRCTTDRVLGGRRQLKFDMLPWPDYFGKAPKARLDGHAPYRSASRSKVAAAPELRELVRGPLDSDRLGAEQPDDYLHRRPGADRPVPHGATAIPFGHDPTEYRTGRVGGRRRRGGGRHRRTPPVNAGRSAPAAVCCWRRAVSSSNDELRARVRRAGSSPETPWGRGEIWAWRIWPASRSGADTDLMDQAWWSPGLTHPDGRIAFALWFTGGIFVNQDGKRFVNESAAYDRIGRDCGRPIGRRLDDAAVLDGLRRRRRRRCPPVKATNVSMVRAREVRRRPGCGTPPTRWRSLAAKIGVPAAATGRTPSPGSTNSSTPRRRPRLRPRRRALRPGFLRRRLAAVHDRPGRRSMRPRSVSPIWAPRAGCAPTPPRGCWTLRAR